MAGNVFWIAYSAVLLGFSLMLGGPLGVGLALGHAAIIGARGVILYDEMGAA